MPHSTICLTFDFDAMSVWFGYSNVTPAMLYRGEYGARVGVPRLLDLLRRYDLWATFFIPGHTIDSFPAEAEAILAAGHEVGHHSYAHIDPSRQTLVHKLAGQVQRLLLCGRGHIDQKTIVVFILFHCGSIHLAAQKTKCPNAEKGAAGQCTALACRAAQPVS